MNIHELPLEIKEDIEDSSLDLLAGIVDHIVLIGGWAVRAHLGEGHGRFTLDVDGVADEADLVHVRERMRALGLKEVLTDWGLKFWQEYSPRVPVPDGFGAAVEPVEMRVEVSGPVTKDVDSHHYFEFSLDVYDTLELGYHRRDASLEVRVPPIDTMAAVKLGLPVDFKNNHDVVGLLQVCDVGNVIEVIRATDDWGEMVLRRLPKLVGRIQQRGRLENALAIERRVDIPAHVSTLRRIEDSLRGTG
jgi:hypothetical protein